MSHKWYQYSSASGSASRRCIPTWKHEPGELEVLLFAYKMLSVLPTLVKVCLNLSPYHVLLLLLKHVISVGIKIKYNFGG